MFRRLSGRLKRFWAALALLSVEMSMVLVLFLGALAAFVFIIRRVFYLHKNQFDYQVFDFLSKQVSPANNRIMLFFTFLGTHVFLIPANLLLIAFYLFIKKHRWYSINIPAIALSSLALMFGLKFFFDRPRPLTPLLAPAKGLSFPSGHALMSVTFYGLLIYIVFKTVKNGTAKVVMILLLLLLIFLIGFSRIYLRVHYASDVIAGYCVGFLWLVICIWLLNRIERYSSKNINPAVASSAASTTKL